LNVEGQPYSVNLALNGQTVLLLYGSLIDGAWQTRSIPLGLNGSMKDQPAELVAAGAQVKVASNSDGFAALIGAHGSSARLATFDAEGRLDHVTPMPLMEGVRETAIASNGRDYLAVLTTRGEVSGIPVTAAGELGARVVLDGRVPVPDFDVYLDPAVAWNGTEWIATYTEIESEARRHMVATTVSADGTEVVDQERVDDARSGQTMAIVGGRTMVSWRPASTSGAPRFTELPLTMNVSRELTFMAGEQTFLASATAGNDLLVIWREKLDGATSIHAGIRMSTGDWIERKLADGPAWVVAASDGNEFLVVLTRSAIRLDRQLNASPPVTLPFAPFTLTWTGAAYGLFTATSGALLSPSGELSQSVTLTSAIGVGAPGVASDGSRLLIAWPYEFNCEFLLCIGARRVIAARFRHDLTRLDEDDIVVAARDDDYGLYGSPVAWNGTEFVVTWTDAARGQFATMIPRNGDSIRTVQISNHTGVHAPSIVAAHGGVVVNGRDSNRTDRYVDRFLFLGADGTIAEHEAIDQSGGLITSSELTVIGGRLAHLASQNIKGAPQHEASHITMALASPTTVPGPPQLDAETNGQNVRLTWSAASGPVTGYRVEYRLGDGAWNEIDQWFGRAERETTFRLSSAGRRAAFRVRAWSDSGTGPYSAPALVNSPRRRAVR
jgi:hypothetical protein